MPADSTTRVCRSCFQKKPLDQFRRHRRGDDSRRATECRECHNRRERVRRSKSPELLTLMRNLGSVKDRLNAVQVLLLLVNTVGGPQKLRELFRAEWEASPPGSRQRQWYLKAILIGDRWVRSWWDR
jgi:hypothetical protein